MKEYALIKNRHLLLPVIIFDRVGSFFSWVFTWGRRSSLPVKPSRILLVRLDHMGDVIMSTVALRALKESFAGLKIDFVAASWAMDVIRYNPCIENLITFDPSWFDRDRPRGFFHQLRDILSLAIVIRRGHYDAVIDFKSDLRNIMAIFLSGVACRIGYSGINGGDFLLSHKLAYRKGRHETDYNLALLKILRASPGKPTVDITLSQDSAFRAEEILKANNVPDRFAVIHAAAGSEEKNWEIKKFANLIDYLSEEKGLSAVIVGLGKDGDIVKDIISKARSEIFDLSGKTDFQSLSAIIKKAALFVGVDSGPAHIAASFDIPTLVLFSGVNFGCVNHPSQWAPRGKNVAIVYPGEGKDLTAVFVKDVRRATDDVLFRD
ncbi:glycosyltransferase family 9 protein [Thermodesulfobacteriota bacterium]